MNTHGIGLSSPSKVLFVFTLRHVALLCIPLLHSCRPCPLLNLSRSPLSVRRPPVLQSRQPRPLPSSSPRTTKSAIICTLIAAAAVVVAVSNFLCKSHLRWRISMVANLTLRPDPVKAGASKELLGWSMRLTMYNATPRLATMCKDACRICF